MQQRQLRLGDILDDYCPRERRVTNHAVVAMIGADVKQTRCTTCDAEHEYKHARVPRQRKKAEAPAALYAQVLAGGPKKVVHGPPSLDNEEDAAGRDEARSEAAASTAEVANHENEDDLIADAATPGALSAAAEEDEAIEEELSDADTAEEDEDVEEGPVHRPLIRAQLPRPEGQPPPARPAPDFTIRQPGGGRPHRFGRHGRGGGAFQGNRNVNAAGGGMRGGGPRQNSGRPPTAHTAKRHGHGRKRSK
jgi:hypothetical protein